jgi:heme-degrading monooxygenase HmoA
MTQPVLPNVLGDEPVTLINAFTVPAAESEHFLELWKTRASILSTKPGFVRSRMHRALIDGAELSFINVAEWESGNALAEARSDPEWLASVQEMLKDPQLHIKARPVVYEVAVEIQPGAVLR